MTHPYWWNVTTVVVVAEITYILYEYGVCVVKEKKKDKENREREKLIEIPSLADDCCDEESSLQDSDQT